MTTTMNIPAFFYLLFAVIAVLTQPIWSEDVVVDTCSGNADVFIALDTSLSDNPTDFDDLRKFVISLSRRIATDSIRVGVVNYDREVAVAVNLKDTATLEQSIEKLEGSSVQSETSDLLNAIKLIDGMGFSDDSDEGALTNIIVIVAHSTIGLPPRVLHQANLLAERNISIVSVLIGDDSKALLEKISSPGSFYLLDKFSQLPTIANDVKKSVCNLISQQNKEIDNLSCDNHCPRGYYHTEECQCGLKRVTKCGHVKCAEDYAPNGKCECVLKVRPPIAECGLECDSPLVLDEIACQCKCDLSCPEDWALDENQCQCVCKILCREGAVPDNKLCQCVLNPCKENQEWREGLCHDMVKKYCDEGQLLVEEVCVDAADCPPGYRLDNLTRRCELKCCRDPYSMEDQCKPESCGENKYWINGQCQLIEETPCPKWSFFDFNKPPCPKTCDEPVQISTCGDPWQGPGCSCYPFFLHHGGECIRPEACPNKPICIKNANVLFLVDGSVSISEDDFSLIMAFIQNTVQRLDLKKGGNSLAVAKFHHQLEMLLNFDSLHEVSKASVLKTLSAVKYTPGLAYLGEALHYIRKEQLFDKRGDSTRILVLFTDGSETTGFIDPNNEARLLREMGVQVVIIKTGQPDLEKQKRIEELSGESGKIFLFGLQHFRDIDLLINRIFNLQCDEIVCPRPRFIQQPCIDQYQYLDKEEFAPNGHKCEKSLIKNAVRRRCACPPAETTETECVNDFHNVTSVNYIFDRQEHICHEKRSSEIIRCACPATEEHRGDCLNEYVIITTKSYILEDTMSHGKFCREVVEERSERCACPATTSRSENCIGGFKVVRTHRYEFQPLTKTCESFKDDLEVRCSCPDPIISTAQCENNRIEVKAIVQRLTDKEECAVDTLVGYEACSQVCNDLVDIGIVVDTSSSIKLEEFGLIKEFLISFVDTLNIGEDHTRVTLMTYSSVNEIRLICDFFTFFHKDALQERISDMRFYPGTTSTGEALKTYRTQALTDSHGSRLNNTKVAQIVYLITDGVANGNIDTPAEAQLLKDKNVKIVVVAIGQQLYEEIADKVVSEPAELNMFHVEYFRDLGKVVQKVSDRRCEMAGGTDHVTVRKQYQGYISKLKELNPDSAISSLDGQEFSHFTKLDESDFCGATLILIGHASVLSGSDPLSINNFKAQAKESISNSMKISSYEIRNLLIKDSEKDAETLLLFDGPCDAIELFENDVKNGWFIFLDKDEKKISFNGGVHVISPYARKFVKKTEIADANAVSMINVINKAASNATFVEELGVLINANRDRIVKVHEIMETSEKETVKLAEEIQQEDLHLVEIANQFIDAIEDVDEKQKVTEEILPFRDLVVDSINKAIADKEASDNYSKKFSTEAVLAAPEVSAPPP